MTRTRTHAAAEPVTSADTDTDDEDLVEVTPTLILELLLEEDDRGRVRELVAGIVEARQPGLEIDAAEIDPALLKPLTRVALTADEWDALESAAGKPPKEQIDEVLTVLKDTARAEGVR